MNKHIDTLTPIERLNPSNCLDHVVPGKTNHIFAFCISVNINTETETLGKGLVVIKRAEVVTRKRQMPAAIISPSQKYNKLGTLCTVRVHMNTSLHVK